MKKIIFFELNEVPFEILDAYVLRFPQSYLAQFLKNSRTFETLCEDKIQLDPWISWPTMHRGVLDNVHGILHLGQRVDKDIESEYPPIWKRMRKAGANVGVFGSLHSSDVPIDLEEYAFYLPDYFASVDTAWPRDLEAFQRFSNRMTRESGRNVTRSIPVRGVAEFSKTLLRNGLRSRTVVDIASFLASEIIDPGKRIRRRTFQPVIMADMFIHHIEKSRPDFSTFYTNHVAAAMHRYWKAFIPGDDTDPVWVEKYKNEIVFALDKLGGILNKLVNFIDNNREYCLVVASSLGQGPLPFASTENFLTVTNVENFMAALKISPNRWSPCPTMVPCLTLALHDIDEEALLSRLSGLKIGEITSVRSSKPDHAITFDIRDGQLHIYIQMDNYAGDSWALIGNERYSHESLGLGLMAHEDGVNCTAQHIPNGSLIIYDPQNASDDRPVVSTLDFVPSVLRNFDLPVSEKLPGQPSMRF